MAKPLIVGNWKAYIVTLKESKALFKAIEKKLPREVAVEVVVSPPHSFLHQLRAGYAGKRIIFGAQDAYGEAGAHTGEVTVAMVRDGGAKYVILGHAERRARGETDGEVAKKVGAVLDLGLTPIVCIGEAARDKEGHYLEVLQKSLEESLALVDSAALKKIVIAYEPVWAIGAALPPNARTIRETIIFIRKVLATRFDRALALKVRVLYGGAVNADSAPELVAESGANGFLLGRASVDADAFVAIVRAW